MGLEWWQIVLGILVGLVILMILVIIHELGHAIAAVRNGVKVEEFGIGFPPRAKILGKIRIPAGKKFRKIQDENGKTLLTINWLLPLGGFCKMKGDDDFASAKKDELKLRKEKSAKKDSFEQASFWAKTKILFAGVLMNVLGAVVIFTVLALIGMPKIVGDQFFVAGDNSGEKGIVEVAEVVENSPAASAGILKGDEILEIKSGGAKSGKSEKSEKAEKAEIQFTEDVSNLTKSHAGETISVKISRNNQTKDIEVKLNDEKSAAKNGFLGVAMQQKQTATIRATWSAPVVGVVDTFQFIWLTIKGLAEMIASLGVGLFGLIVQNPEQSAQISAAADGVAGPIGIFGTLFPTAMMQGPITLLWLTALISISLAIMNILPIPALDGGRWYLLAWYKIRRKKLTKEREESIVGIGFLVIIALVILITIHDVWRLF